MTITITRNELTEYFGNPLMFDVPIEEVLVREYKYNRREGVDYVELLKNEFLKLAFNATKEEINIEAVVSSSKLLTVTYSILEKLDVLLLMRIEDMLFTDIKYLEYKDIDSDREYIFEVIHGNK